VVLLRTDDGRKGWNSDFPLKGLVVLSLCCFTHLDIVWIVFRSCASSKVPKFAGILI
jgi:hypothetical protein